MDREKVIKAIDICLGHGKCDDCGYRIKGGYSTMDCRKPMMRDALELLKEHEEVKPIPPIDESDLWRCGYCHHQIFRCTHQRFCEECGRKIGWGDM